MQRQPEGPETFSPPLLETNISEFLQIWRIFSGLSVSMQGSQTVSITYKELLCLLEKASGDLKVSEHAEKVSKTSFRIKEALSKLYSTSMHFGIT